MTVSTFASGFSDSLNSCENIQLTKATVMHKNRKQLSHMHVMMFGCFLPSCGYNYVLHRVWF